MKNRILIVCAAATLVTSVTGCGTCRRLRDFVCRGARCGAAPATAAPAPLAVAPMAMDPGCGYAGYDPGCGYPGGQVVGYPPAYDSGWMQGGPACDSCSGGYSMPSYDSGTYVEPGDSTVYPGPANGG